MKCPFCKEHRGYSDSPCPNCDGLGFINELGVVVSCLDCAGRGLAPCPRCYGQATIALGYGCPKCQGDGDIPCPQCARVGVIPFCECERCKDSGYVDCPKCHGCGHWELGLYHQQHGTLRPRYERIVKHE